MDISFIIVNYKSERFLKDCLLSLSNALGNISSEIIIVNNDETDLTDIKKLELRNLQITNNAVNDGFAKACNIGAKLATGDIYFFLNPDTEFKKFDIEQFLRILDNEKIGIAAPQLIEPDGSVQLWSYGKTITLLDIIKNNFKLAKSKQLKTTDATTEFDWVSGGAFAIKRHLFEKLSGFDENFFMYFEDVDLCKRLKGLGQKIILVPSMQILHLGGRSASSAKQQKKYYYASQDYYFKKHRGLLELFFLKILRGVVLVFKG